MTEDTANSASLRRKPVLMRIPEALYERVSSHREQLSLQMGGARVSFTAAALSLMQAGLDSIKDAAP